MKTSTLLLGLLSISTFAHAGVLDGSTFCRTVTTSNFGPNQTVSHCISFQNDVATDNANTFFGNPPKSYHYRIVGNMLINADANEYTGYLWLGDKLFNKLHELTRV